MTQAILESHKKFDCKCCVDEDDVAGDLTKALNEDKNRRKTRGNRGNDDNAAQKDKFDEF